eukprot:765029-Hanusia_phi.AAC.1
MEGVKVEEENDFEVALLLATSIFAFSLIGPSSNFFLPPPVFLPRAPASTPLPSFTLLVLI